MNSFALSHLEMEVRVPIFGTGTVVNRWNWNSNLHHFGLYRFKTLDKQQICTQSPVFIELKTHIPTYVLYVFGVGLETFWILQSFQRLLQWLQPSFYCEIWHSKLPNSVIKIRNYSPETWYFGNPNQIEPIST